jgi:predicted aspartyl protease
LKETQSGLARCFQLQHHCVVSAYYVDLIAINPKREEIRSAPVRVLVDTGSELSWLPIDVLAGTGIQPRRKRLFRMADGRTMDRDVGFCILESEGFITNDEVVFAQPGDMHLLGVRTLEGFGVTVDPLAHRLVATVTLAATNAWPI